MDAALKRFEAERLPDLHALFLLDLTAVARAGSGWGGTWNPHSMLLQFHNSLWNKLAKQFPGAVSGSEVSRMASQRLPYRQVCPLAQALRACYEQCMQAWCIRSLLVHRMQGTCLCSPTCVDEVEFLTYTFYACPACINIGQWQLQALGIIIMFVANGRPAARIRQVVCTPCD